MAVFDEPRGTGPYGITTTPDGRVFFASLAGNYLGRINLDTGTTTVFTRSRRRSVLAETHSRGRDGRRDLLLP
jgi:streptogramin lyase